MPRKIGTEFETVEKEKFEKQIQNKSVRDTK